LVACARSAGDISTAYVAGEHTGQFNEDDLDVGQRFRNAYEQSKFEAESLVASRRARLPITVLRPSIVVGESDSGWTTSFNVVYWPLRAFSRGAYLALPARREAPVDVVPVDYVADAIFALSQAACAEGVPITSPPGRARATWVSSSSSHRGASGDRRRY
jgi:long-chain acyl-CoA synthetase